MKAIKISVGDNLHNRIEVVDIEDTEPHYKAFAKAIESDWIEYVRTSLPAPYCMIAGEEAKLTGQPPNILASYLYGTHQHGDTVNGDVIIMKDVNTPDGIETAGLEQDDVFRVLEFLMERL